MKKNLNAFKRKAWEREAKLILVSLFVIMSALFTDAKAQCIVQCSPTLEISLFNRNDFQITVEMVVLNPYQNCPGATFEIKVYDSQGNHTGDFVNHTMLNEQLTAEATNVINGMSCQTQLTVVDDIAPTIGCTDLFVSCGDSILPEQIGYPSVSDNIYLLTQNDLFYSEQREDFPCFHQVNGQEVTTVIHRNWKAIDSSGNLGNCIQDIYFLRKTLADVVFPLDRDGFDVDFLICGEDDPSDLAKTGTPTIDGNSLKDFHNCEMAVTHFDNVNDLCGGEQQILRHWTVTDWCIDSSLTHVQVIRLKDVSPPDIQVADTLKFTMDLNECTATVALPIAVLTDNCSDAEQTVHWSYGLGIGPFSNVASGNHTVTYTATDDCGNASTKTLTVMVEDDQVPTAVCDLEKELTLLGDGTSTVFASTFDDGSWDNCGIALIEVSRDSQMFSNQITFTCDDMGPAVPVVLKVTDVNGFTNSCDVKVGIVDNIRPTITCPQAVVMECTEDVYDLTVTGLPVGADNCTVDTITFADNAKWNSCGIGLLERHWTIRDMSGNEAACIQSITVEDNTEINVWFPADFMVFDCGADMSSSVAGEPQVTGGNCENLEIKQSDELYTNGSSCSRIVRTWTIIDWCIYTGDTDGLWEDTQVIEMIDTIAPEVTPLADATVGAGNFECEALVEVPSLTATDCSGTISITNDSPYAILDGDNASGMYPIGEHIITFSVSDGCGNMSQTTLKITVEDDKPPTPICNRGVTLSLNSDGTIAIHTSIIANGVFDNCSLTGNVTLELTPYEFTCDDVGDQEVMLTAVDESGNEGFCTTIVDVQDNLSVCNTGQNSANIAGTVSTVSGEPAVQVLVGLTGGIPRGIQTNPDGSYLFEGLPKDEDYSVIPNYDVDADEGVSTLDLVLITKHVLNVQPFTSPYQWIAADANRSDEVTTLDIVAIRKVVLRSANSFPNNTSWRFVDAKHQFLQGNPLLGFIPEAVNINNLAWNHLNTDFIAIKVGDVNGNAKLNTATGIDDRSGGPVMNITTNNQFLKENELAKVPIILEEATTLAGMQMTIEFDTEKLEWSNIESSEFVEMDNRNLGQSMLSEGILTLSWNSEEHASIPKTGALFFLNFKVKKDVEVEKALTLNSKYTNAEAYVVSETEMQSKTIEFHVTDETDVAVGEVENFPNPFYDATTLTFTLEHDATLELRLYDLNGKLLSSKLENFTKGTNRWHLHSEDFTNQFGVIGYQLFTKEGLTGSGKLIRMKRN